LTDLFISQFFFSDHTLIADVLQVLNQIVYELPAEHPLAETRPLRELVGHTPPEVSEQFYDLSKTCLMLMINHQNLCWELLG